jgi:pilus assembly protein CpaB
MDSRKVLLMVGALAFAAVCAVLARSMFGGAAVPVAEASAPAVANGPEVMVATRSLPAGTIITADAFRYAPWPKELVDGAYYIKGGPESEKMLGTVVRLPIPAGQPITQGALVKPGDRGFLAAALGPGMRAVTIPISAQSGVAGFVFPGDRVDLLLTQAVSGTGDPLKVTETIVRNLRVLATDQSTDKTTDDKGKTQVQAFSMVTVEVTPKLSEKISVAQTIGSLSLALRPIADDRMELEREIASGEIDVPASNDPKAETAMLLQLAAKPIDSNPSFSTGGEVSRFQRSTVPPKSEAAPAAPAAAAAGGAPVVVRPRGPVVTVTRGQAVTEVPVRGS